MEISFRKLQRMTVKELMKLGSVTVTVGGLPTFTLMNTQSQLNNDVSQEELKKVNDIQELVYTDRKQMNKPEEAFPKSNFWGSIVTCPICGKEVYDKKASEHYAKVHPDSQL